MKVMCVRAAAAIAAVFSSSVWAQAEEWPRKTLRVICPFAAGGATDIFARVFSQRLQIALKQNVVVDNRGGAGTVSHGPVVDADDFMAGLWILDVESETEAHALAAEASRACNRRIEVRAIL